MAIRFWRDTVWWSNISLLMVDILLLDTNKAQTCDSHDLAADSASQVSLCLKYFHEMLDSLRTKVFPIFFALKILWCFQIKSNTNYIYIT